MAVGKDDFLYADIHLFDGGHDFVDITTRVYNRTFASAFALDDAAVLLVGRNRHNGHFDRHGSFLYFGAAKHITVQGAALTGHDPSRGTHTMKRLPTLTDASLTLENRVATLTFQRNDVRNALTGTALIEDIVQTAAWANLNREVSVLIITGDGKAFSSGGNVKEMREKAGLFGGNPAELQEQYRQGIQRIPLAMQYLEVPTIAAVNGAAIGAGFDLCNMCDIRIGCPDTLLGETFINLGIIPGDGGAWFLQRVAGYQRAFELSLTGRLIKADEALEYGILMEVVESDALLARAGELAALIASKPPRGVRMTKRLLQAAQRMELRDLLDMSASMQAISHQTDDHVEAVNAFLDKRTPEFKGN